MDWPFNHVPANAADVTGVETVDVRCPTKHSLLLNQTMQLSRSPASSLLQMPVELLAQIVGHLVDDKSTLANLALVNVECRQLARIEQFRVTKLDYSRSSDQLLEALGTQSVLDGVLGPDSNFQSIGPCIRSLDICFLHDGHRRPCRECCCGQDDTPENRRVCGNLRAKSDGAWRVRWLTNLLLAVGVMPNLTDITWSDKVISDDLVFKILRESSAMHLEINAGRISTPLELACSSWPLKSLHITTMVWHFGELDEAEEHNVRHSRLVTKLLGLCAETLEDFHWESKYSNNQIQADGAPALNRLRKVKCEAVRFAPETWSSVLSPSLRELHLRGFHEGAWSLLDSALTLGASASGLETLTLGMVSQPVSRSELAFLSEHRHLRSLNIEYGVATVLGNHILPLLSEGSFNNLASLSIHWGADSHEIFTVPGPLYIPNAHLALIAKLRSLRQLHLKACGFWPQMVWAADHDALRKHLAGSTNLQRLALTGEGYSAVLGDVQAVQQYYKAKDLTSMDRRLLQARPRLDAEMGWFQMVQAKRAEAKRKHAHTRRLRFLWRTKGGRDMHPLFDDTFERQAWEYLDAEAAHKGASASELGTHDLDDSLEYLGAHYFSFDYGDLTNGKYTGDPASLCSRYFAKSRSSNGLTVSFADEKWELMHRNFILDEAEKYAAAFPKMDWVYMGQWPMQIKVPGESSFGNAVPLAKAREALRMIE